MPGESQKEPATGQADPSVLTTESMLREVGNAKGIIDEKLQSVDTRFDGIDRATALLHDDFVRFPTEVQREVGHLKELMTVRLDSSAKLAETREAHRLELKADSERTLSTAREADQKRVDAALAAAEKARDQQTVASQLATDKSEKRLIDALEAQGNTFSAAIANLVSALNDSKQVAGELRSEIREVRAEKRGGQQNTAAIYAFVGFLVAVIGLFMLTTGAFG